MGIFYYYLNNIAQINKILIYIKHTIAMIFSYVTIEKNQRKNKIK